jgi:hypothetical protein
MTQQYCRTMLSGVIQHNQTLVSELELIIGVARQQPFLDASRALGN